MGATFKIRQIIKKSIEHGQSAFQCVKHLTTALDKVKLNDIIKSEKNYRN